MSDDVWNECQEIAFLLNTGDEENARERLLKLVDFLKENNMPHDSLINHLLRVAGLYSYIDEKTADWDDLLAKDIFEEINKETKNGNLKNS